MSQNRFYPKLSPKKGPTNGQEHTVSLVHLPDERIELKLGEGRFDQSENSA